MPAIEAVLTTTPRWPSASGSLSPMAAATSRVVLKVPSAFISIVWTKESLSWGTPPRPTVRPPPTPPPATLDRESTPLNSRLSLHAALPICVEGSECVHLHRLDEGVLVMGDPAAAHRTTAADPTAGHVRSGEHTSELPSLPTRRSSDLC